MIPRAQGGKQHRHNLIGACGACNLEKSDQTWFVWYRSQIFWTLEREERILGWINQPQFEPPAPIFVNWMEKGTLLLPSAA